MQQRTPLSTPLDKVRLLLQRYQNEPKSKCRCVLLSTGSYNPIHRMHVESFYLARRAVEERNLLVVGAFLSPSHDDYVRWKLGTDDCIGTNDRLKMCDLTINAAKQKREASSDCSGPTVPSVDVDADFLSLDKWESIVCSSPVDFSEVTVNLRDYLAEQFPDDNIRVIYLCGSDHFFRCHCMTPLRNESNVSVAVLKRPSHHKHNDYRDGGFNLTETLEKFTDVYVVETSTEDDCSSTLIRKRARQGQSISDFVFPEVEDYMRCKCIFYTSQPSVRVTPLTSSDGLPKLSLCCCM